MNSAPHYVILNSPLHFVILKRTLRGAKDTGKVGSLLPPKAIKKRGPRHQKRSKNK